MRKKSTILFLVAVSCVGCGADGSVSAAQTSPTLLVHDVRGRGDDAAVDGYVRYLEGADCFVLEAVGGGGVRNVAVWPPGTTVWLRGGAVAGVRVPDRDPIALGGRVTGSGGYANPTTSELDLPAVAPDCLSGGGEFVMVHRLTP
ncbi:hypothetical protein O7635_31675 [Asanoa sp. WMMD1127]|uniref:hypothetical protein n=1 Tax=Asanoa sp. WMMD1127 TaxID=3016107 RepID=UPI002417DEF1|nr:hypothetical protein [Asanoa sp. WMMD1127]MDG4826433.1 hypothetical protein [Asanoa sp. WMMD1127]